MIKLSNSYNAAIKINQLCQKIGKNEVNSNVYMYNINHIVNMQPWILSSFV